MSAASGFDTEVRGEPGTLRDCVRWLRGTVSGDLRDAAGRQAGARRDAAGGWEGASCEAYRDVGAVAISATDDHAARVGRAADDVEDVADRLSELRRTMADVRADARSSGLQVEGTRVLVPFPVLGLRGPQGVVPDGGAGDPSYAVKRAAYDRLERRAGSARRDAEAWIADHLARAGERAAERGDVEVLRRRLTGPVPSGGVAAPAPIAAPAGPVAPITDPVNGLAGAGSSPSAPSAPSAPAPPGGGVTGPEGGAGRGQDGVARAVPVDLPPRGRPRWVEEPGRRDAAVRVDAPCGLEDRVVRIGDTVARVEGSCDGEDAGGRVADRVETVPGGLPTAEPGEVPVAAPGVRRSC